MSFCVVGALGSERVGKSSLLQRFAQRSFQEEASLEDGFFVQCTIDNELTNIRLVDIYLPWEFEYDHLRDQKIREAQGFVLVYSVTSRQSFEQVPMFYRRVLRIKRYPDTPVLIVANKCDRKSEREVTPEQGRELASNLNCRFYETSAKYDVNVDASMFDILQHTKRYRPERRSSTRTNKDKRNSDCVVL